jgi:hypothetical protein
MSRPGMQPSGDDCIAGPQSLVEAAEAAGLRVPAHDVGPLWEQWNGRRDDVAPLLAANLDGDDIGVGWDA